MKIKKQKEKGPLKYGASSTSSESRKGWGGRCRVRNRKILGKRVGVGWGGVPQFRDVPVLKR